MTGHSPATTTTTMMLSKKLEILRHISDGHNLAQAAQKFEIDCDSMKRIVDQRARLEKVPMKSKQRNNLKVKEKIQMLHFVESGYSVPQASMKFDVQSRIFMRILVQKNELYDMEAQGAPVDVAGVLKGRYPDIERDVLEFIGFVRNERLPVTLSLIRTRPLLSGGVCQHNDFKAARGWVAKFLRCTRVQPSLRLHGKRGIEITDQSMERMEEIRSIAAEYSLDNIYDQNESGLFYRMGPNRTYLGKDETRSSARGTSFQKYKERLTVVFGANASGTHVLPIRYIGVSKSPV